MPIAQTKDFQGVTGKITLDAERNANKASGCARDQRRKVPVSRDDFA
jgi:hypothetical protein